MAPSNRRLLLVLLVSVALFANPLWLFPDEGETRYTYERSELVPHGDDIEYVPPPDPIQSGSYNDLARIGCESGYGGVPVDRDLSGRTCAFEQSIADDGPVRVDGEGRDSSISVGYVELDDGYYHRVSTRDSTGVTLALEPLSAEQVLASVSTAAAADVDPDRIQRSKVAARTVVTADPVGSLRSPRDVAVGQVYRYEGAYYAAFVTDSDPVDAPLPDPVRLLASFVGFVGGLSAFLLGLARLPVEQW